VGAIEAGEFPGMGARPADLHRSAGRGFSFDVLDATKLIPEELVPVTPVGRMVLNRNPDNFFAETEQVAFCTAHVVPGIDFSNDPLLAGRIHSYLDTQITRLGGPTSTRSRSTRRSPRAQQPARRHAPPGHPARAGVAYEPNSLAGGCPFQAGAAGFVSFPAAGGSATEQVRGKPEKFADHYTQATLFYESQTPVEQGAHRGGFRFELSKHAGVSVRRSRVSGW
jgi:catalase